MAEVKNELTLEALAAQMAILQATIDSQAKTIVDLKGKVAETKLDEKVELPTIPTEPVKRNGKEYAWQVAILTVPIYGKLKATEAALSDEVIDAILAVPGQGILKELV